MTVSKCPAHPAAQMRGGEAFVTVTVPLVLVVGAVVIIAWRYLGLRWWHALICLLFGFLLAAATPAPDIRSVIRAALSWLTGQ